MLAARRCVFVVGPCSRFASLPSPLVRQVPLHRFQAKALGSGQYARASVGAAAADVAAVSAASVDTTPVGVVQPTTATFAKKGLINQPHLWWKLSKGKLTVWVALSALPGYFLALPASVDPILLAALGCGTFLTSTSAQTLNQMIEVERDAKMKRTENRPLPSGQIEMSEAAAFAAVTGGGGLAILSLGATPATAAVAAATILTYAAAYTPLKVRTPYNTHVGAVSGSLPTVMGFTAALGGAGLAASPWAAHALWIFGMQTLWQMPHFYALAWLYRSDYLRGGYKMFPITDPTGHATAAMSKPYLVALVAMPWAASACGLASWMLPVGALVPSAYWWMALKAFERKPTSATCRRFFLHSLSYLLAMLALFTCYAHVESPALSSALPLAEDSVGNDSNAVSSPPDEGSTTNRVEISGPAWRAAVHRQLLEICPHETLRTELFGSMRESCPFTGRTQS
eukprot:TRINITY_DN48680_c0_g1_i1.p1 TRINITY_DN48680_c0_g1~~TRINITY_DN48680_c0_g1_i1.p1  ORF type:complete len:456 (-),score=62.85 TRINITY_DN48680_c0_g1_i1:42-1409(-)